MTFPETGEPEGKPHVLQWLVWLSLLAALALALVIAFRHKDEAFILLNQGSGSKSMSGSFGSISLTREEAEAVEKGFDPRQVVARAISEHGVSDTCSVEDVIEEVQIQVRVTPPSQFAVSMRYQKGSLFRLGKELQPFLDRLHEQACASVKESAFSIHPEAAPPVGEAPLPAPE